MAKRTARPAAKAEEGTEAVSQLTLKRLEVMRFTFRVEGETPLIIHKWSEKAKREMEEKGGPARAKRVRPQRDRNADFQEARYLLEMPRKDRHTDGIPAVAFKAAIVQAARAFEGVTMTALKQFIYVEGEPPEMLVPIIGKPEMREDMVRVGKGLNKTADLRWRPQYWPWAVDLTIRWPSSMFDLESIVTLLDAAGQGGVGEWRPTAPQSMTGIFGQFRVTGKAVKG